jgi:hypothetical protein
MVAPIQIGPGIQFGAGINIGAEVAPITGGTVTYLEMDPPVIPGNQLEDSTATVNDPIGFTINDSGATGVAVANLTPSNQTFFNNQGLGFFAASFGPGSTHATATVNITQTGSYIIFYIDPALSYPATFNYPITIA